MRPPPRPLALQLLLVGASVSVDGASAAANASNATAGPAAAAPAAAAPAAPATGAEDYYHSRITLQSFGTNPALTIPMAMAFPQRQPESGVAEPPADNPAQVLGCLERHRFTPTACAQAVRPAAHAPASPPPPDIRRAECHAAGGIDAVCHYGRGRCAYDDKRGWFCACASRSARDRRLRASAAAFALAPDCIETTEHVESAAQVYSGSSRSR